MRNADKNRLPATFRVALRVQEDCMEQASVYDFLKYVQKAGSNSGTQKEGYGTGSGCFYAVISSGRFAFTAGGFCDKMAKTTLKNKLYYTFGGFIREIRDRRRVNNCKTCAS